MNIPEILALPFGSPVPCVAGFLEKLYPAKTDARWSLQNGTIRDRAGNELEIMFSRFPTPNYLNPLSDRGKWVEITAVEAGDVVWAEQRLQTRGTFGKLEVKSPRTVRLFAAPPATEPDLFSSASAPAIIHSAEKAAPARPSVTPAVPAATARSDMASVQSSIAQLASLYELCFVEARGVVERLALDEAQRHQTTLSATSTIFVQASREGLHHKLSMPELARLKLPDYLRDLALAIGENEDAANMLLRFQSVIKVNQTWRDVPAERVREVLDNPMFLETLRRAG